MSIVRPGQIWQDCDKRQSGRLVIVSRVEGEYAYCHWYSPQGREYPSIKTRLLLRRMKPSSTGWRLIRDVEP